MNKPKRGNIQALPELVLRIAVFGTFLGHGIVALKQNPDWVPFITFWGISQDHAYSLMIVVGMIDILVATITVIKPNKVILGYAVFWAFSTALMRPLTGITIWAFVERTSNWGAPLALLIWRSTNRSSRR